MKQNTFIRLILILLFWQLAFNSHAQKGPRATESEMQMLPKLCQLRFKYGKDSKEFKPWRVRLGPEAIHIHHYCDGLVLLFRSNIRDRHRNSKLNAAKSNFRYVLHRVTNPKFILLPDLYYRMAIVSKEQGNTAEAIQFANKSIEAKKKYLNPYLLLADIYMESKMKKEAKEILLKAKAIKPKSKRLQYKLKKLQ